MAPSRNRRPGFSRRAQYSVFAGYVIAIAGIAISAILLLVATLSPTAFSVLRSAAAEVTAPVSSGIAAIGRGFFAIPATVSSFLAVRQENAALRRELDALRPSLLSARAVAYDNRRLRALLRIREGTSAPVTVARLISSSASSTRRFALLNAGGLQGVRRGQPVRGPDGLIGRVLETGPNTARILLLADPESIVPVRRTRDGLTAMASGRGDGLIDIRSVAIANVVFQAGDIFVTSGTGGIYAPNIPVARILQSARDTALARTFAQPDTLDFALVEQAFMPVAPPVRGDRP